MPSDSFGARRGGLDSNGGEDGDCVRLCVCVFARVGVGVEQYEAVADDIDKAQKRGRAKRRERKQHCRDLFCCRR